MAQIEVVDDVEAMSEGATSFAELFEQSGMSGFDPRGKKWSAKYKTDRRERSS